MNVDVVDSIEAPEAELGAIIEKKNGKYVVHARDKKESWATNPIDSIEEVWDYIRKWFSLRGITLDLLGYQ